MDQFEKTILSSPTIEQFSNAFSKVYLSLPPDIGKQLRDTLRSNFLSYGIEGAYRRMNNRTVGEILAEFQSTDANMIACGKVGGVRFELYDAPRKSKGDEVSDDSPRAYGGGKEVNLTESEWLARTHPEQMLRYLGTKLSSRKQRLFDCALCRHIWHLIPDERARIAVHVAECFADGLAGSVELDAARVAAEAALAEHNSQRSKEWACRACCCAAMESAGEAARVWLSVLYAVQMQGPAVKAPQPGWPDRLTARMNSAETELSYQVAVLRDIVGPIPFRPVVPEPRWLSPPVAQLTETVYAGRSFDRLPPLADALEAAGCTSAEILEHIRGPGPHVRGCWALDLILSKDR